MIRVTFGILLLILLAHNYHYDSFIDIIVCNTALFIMLMKWRLKFWAHHKMDPSNSAYTRKVSVVSTMPFDARNLKNNSNRIPFEQLTVRERSSHRNNISSNIYNRSKSHAIVKKRGAFSHIQRSATMMCSLVMHRWEKKGTSPLNWMRIKHLTYLFERQAHTFRCAWFGSVWFGSR